MNKTEKKYLYAIIAILAVVLVANEGGFMTQYGYPPIFPLKQTGNGNGGIVPPPSSKDDYAAGVGVYQLNVLGSDSANPATVRDVTDNVKVYWMHYRGGQWTMDSTAYDDDATNYYTAKDLDNGYAWVAIVGISGQHFYIDYNKIRNNDPYISSMQHVDVTGDGTPDFVFQYDLKNHQIPNAGYPIIQFSVYLITADTAGTTTRWTWNTQANQTGVGAAVNMTFTENYLTPLTLYDGIALYQFRIKANTTDETRIRLMNFEIPGIGKLDGTAFQKTFTDTSTIWTYQISTTLNGADYLTYMPNTVGKFYVNMQIQLLLQAGDKIGFTLYADYLQDVTGAGMSISPTFPLTFVY